MSSIRVTNIQTKADASSPTVDEKLKVLNSQGNTVMQVDAKTSGITTVGINTTGNTFTVNSNNGVTFAGVVTATTFSGDLTGNATGLSGTPNITVGTIGATSLNASGVVTATSFSGSGANLTGIGGTTDVRTNSLVVSGVTTVTTLSATSIVGVTTAGITTAYIGSVNDGPLAGFRNFIINGSMQVWQRGTSITSIGYNADRFMGYSTNTGTANYGLTVTRQQDSPIGLKGYCAEIALSNSGGLIDKVTFGQRIEAINFYGIKSGDSMTFSFYLKRIQAADSNLTIYVKSAGNSIDSYTNASVNQNFYDTDVANQSLGTFNSLSTSWTRYTFTFIVTDALITNGGVIFLQNGDTDLNVTNTNALYRTTGWQLEPGTVATPFERRSYGQELALAQRYYYRINASTIYTTYGTGWNRSSSAGRALIQHPVIMRTSPSSIDYNLLSSTISGVSEALITSASMESNHNSPFTTVLETGSSGAFTTGFFHLTAKNSTSSYLGFSAEL